MYPSIVAEQTRATVIDYLRTTLSLRDGGLEAALFRFLDGDDGLFRGPYLNLRLPYRQAAADAPIPLKIAPPYRPYAHQLAAWQRLSSADGRAPQPTLVTTGTGSGKTECFLYPLLDHCYRHRGQPGVKAVILYPMNALATDQARRVAKELAEHPLLAKGSERVTAGLYVGGKGSHGATTAESLCDMRSILRQSPPDILLTNYKMLDYLLVRPDDAGLWAHNRPDTLRYLVLDELHTFDGAQGSDVACLIRRLCDRLEIPAGGLCPVGTSATVGASEAGTEALVRFANEVFGTPIDADAIVREDRYDLEEFLGPPDYALPVPDAGFGKHLEPSTFEDPEMWAANQAIHWLGRAYTDPVVLGERLAVHPTVRHLLEALGGRLMAWPDLLRGLARRDADFRALPPDVQRLALDSLLGLVAAARRRVGTHTVPWVTVQVQLWIRELRRLLRKIPATLDEPPAFGWTGEIEAESGVHWLPMVHCRECGVSGFGAIQSELNPVLKAAAAEVGRAWIARSHRLRVVLPGANHSEGFPEYLDPTNLNIDMAPTRSDGAGNLPVTVERRAGGAHRRFYFRCPACDADDSLRMLGARSASLGSVIVGHAFSSPYNRDKKLIAFTDSVQDAAHRAGFFGARTYRFNLRTALLSAIRDGRDVPMAQLGAKMVEFWSSRLPQPELVATLLPSDLVDLPSYQAFRKTQQGPAKRLMQDLTQRMSWEITREFGLLAEFGHSLERTGCAVASPDDARMGQAAEAFHRWLVEEHATPRARQLALAQVRHFLAGLVHRTRVRGGIFDPLLAGYVKNQGKRFHLSKKRQPLMSPFGPRSRLPKFLADRPGDVFETYVGGADTVTWYRDWCARVFEIPASYGEVPDLYRAAVRCLVDAGVFVAKPSGKGQAFGLDPAHLLITTRRGQVTCDRCGADRALSAADAERWSDQRCLTYRCLGRLAPTSSDRRYYADAYGSGRLQRVFAAEHTGLLTREVREDVERRFKAGVEPDAPNLLVATPTLEMGIDVGDLSAVLLCSVPPTTANYLQRVGRAGRATGNALCLTLVNARPHDQYFFAEPEAMMAGEVVPPGCFLDAPEMLKRQMVAHAMDQWARAAGGAIPGKVALVLGDAGERGFPGVFLTWYRERQASLTDAFLALFSPATLSPRNRERLRTYGLSASEGVEADVRGAFAAVAEERERLRVMRRRLREQIAALQAAEAELDDEAQQRLDELEQSGRVLSRIADDLLARYPLNVLTDAGVLPNYAFPEPGVKLRSVVRKPVEPKPADPKQAEEGAKKKRGRYTTHEYVRPAQAALRELAPFNTFYAEGRKVEINEVDVGSRARPLVEQWRFCAACHYQVRLADNDVPKETCPSCGHEKWPDTGQVRSMLHFRRALSLADLLTSRTVDDSDDRRQVDYQTHRLIHVGQENWDARQGAYVNADIPFGFERLQDVTLREINFGPKVAAAGHGVELAGKQVRQEGFDVCLDCGRVRDDRRRDAPEINHAPYCKSVTSKTAERTARLFLYREVTSEAIRILLPVSTVGWEMDRASFQAALALGLRRRFNGNPGHLLLATVSEPMQTDHAIHRRFMVLYDGVPGGSGYLAELSRPEELRKVFAGALGAMRTCRCNAQDGKDGCPRCVLAHQPQADLPSISRKRAIELIEPIVNAWDQLARRATLSEVELDAKLESELEFRFVDALRKHAARSADVTFEATIYNGETCYRLEIGQAVWRIEKQVWYGPENSALSENCRVDFRATCLTYPGGAPAKPVLIECDGLAYHVQPEDPIGRLRDDVRKRTILLESCRVWSITWKDVDRFQGNAEAGTPTVFGAMNAPLQGALLGKLANPWIDPDRRASGSVDLLLDYLRHPVDADWRAQAEVIAMGGLVAPFPTGEAATAVKIGLESEPTRFTPPTAVQPAPPNVMSWAWFGAWAGAQVWIAQRDLEARDARLTLRLFDEPAGRKDVQFEADWRAILQAWNLLQWLDPEVWTSSDQGPAAADSIERVPDRPDDAVQALIDEEIFTPGFAPILRALAAAGVDLDTLADYTDTDGPREIGSVALAWPEAKLGVFGPWEAEFVAGLCARGWTLHPADTDPALILPALLAAHRGEA